MKSMAGVFLTLLFFSSTTYVFSDCTARLNRADELYRSTKYDSALTLVNSCLSEPNLSEPDKVEGFKLLGKISVMLGDRQGSRHAFIQMLRLRPLMQISENEPEVNSVFNEARDEFFSGAGQPPAGKSRNWPWLVVSGAVMAAVIALML